MDHPSHGELAALCSGTLPVKREREVVRHLVLERCPDCLAAAPPPLGVLLGTEPAPRPPTPEEEASYGAAVDRAGAKALDMERHLRAQRAQADRGLKALEAGRKLPRSLGHLARMWAYLDRSWQLRHHDPQEMVYFAWYAVRHSLRLDGGLYGRERVRDFEARAEAELGNAYRTADRLQDAEHALGRARRLFEQGTGDPILEIRLLELEASLLAHLNQFGRATQKLLKVLKFHERRKDLHLAGRTLVLIGVYTGNAGNYELAVWQLEQSLKLIDPERDPSLACSAAHNSILFLVDSGRIAKAKKLRLVLSRYLRYSGGRISEIKFRILEGRIAFGEGHHHRAEDIFREVVADLDQATLPFHAGIERLDLSAALLAQGKAREAGQTVTEAAKLFTALGIQREAFQAVVLLRDTFRMRSAKLEMVLEVADFLRHGMNIPGLRFAARSWEER